MAGLNEQLKSLLLLKGWKLYHLKQMNCVVVTCGLSHHTCFFSKLLRLCLLLPSFPSSYASSLFNHITKPTIHIWNIMFKGFSNTSHPQNSISFYIQMRQHGVFPNKHTFPLLLRANNENPHLILPQIFKFGYISDQFVQNSLVSSFASSGYVDLARQVFDDITHKDVLSYTALIDGYARNALPVRALELFLEMKQAQVKVDEVAVVAGLSPAGMLRCVWFGKCLHAFYVELGRVSRDVYIGSALVDMYAKCGYWDDALKVFEDMPYKNLISWTAMIAGSVHCNRFREALSVFEEMLSRKVVPNQVTLTSVLSASTKLGALEQGRWIANYIKAHNVKFNTALATALIDMYSKCGSLERAGDVFDQLVVKDVVSFNAMIMGLAVNGKGKEALKLFSQMLDLNLRPNAGTFLGLLCACSHTGLAAEGRQIFKEMSQCFRIAPRLEHYASYIDLLARVGYVEEALQVATSMPFKPNNFVLGALLGGCVLHNRLELARIISSILVEVDPNNSAGYVMLSNTYAIDHHWGAISRLRLSMKEKGVVKQPGCSWINVDGVVHEFLAGSSSHPQNERLHSELQVLLKEMKLASI